MVTKLLKKILSNSYKQQQYEYPVLDCALICYIHPLIKRIVLMLILCILIFTFFRYFGNQRRLVWWRKS